MENYKGTIVHPIIARKAVRYVDADSKITSEIRKGTSKAQIKQTVEAIFGVDVKEVDVVNVRPKTKRIGKYVDTIKNIRKAYMRIKEGQNINLFGEEAE